MAWPAEGSMQAMRLRGLAIAFLLVVGLGVLAWLTGDASPLR